MSQIIKQINDTHSIIETKYLIKLLEKTIAGLELCKLEDPEWDYNSQIADYKLELELLTKL